LSAAKELRDGIRRLGPPPPKLTDAIRGTPTGLLLDALAIQVNSRKAEGMKFKLNLVYPDNGETFVVEMSNATLTHIAGHQAKDADLTITLNRSDLEEIMLGKTKLAELARAGKARLDGNPAVLQQLAAACEMFDPMFQIMPGTKAPAEPPKPKDEVFKNELPPVHVP
jgi:alkyl sulfatase BDS1-like metallo-beta-lactamase superfamily hydrolase